MYAKPLGTAEKAYMKAGAGEILARSMVALHNPLYENRSLSYLEKSASLNSEWRALGFLYLFKGMRREAKMNIETAYSMGDSDFMDDFRLVLGKWDEVCQLVNSAKGRINQLRLKRKQKPLDKLLG